ncbi:MAG: rRNA pseudouridine synthase [Clostridia bacterium]|nr:rRNA pseudouridine synthase [Clostridia bacterium]MBQ9758121.1 rRNA pseudouridine synthase [Clostridia bacterium]
MRLDRFLAECGLGTRNEVKKIIRSGAVTLNGQVTKSADAAVVPTTDSVAVLGREMIYREFIYLMLNKPGGYISATRDGKTPTVLDLLPDEYRHFEPFPVGRLDIDTEGLLILTNDGDLAHRLLSPKKHVPKTYIAQIEKPVKTEDVDAFSRGVVLDDGYKTLPAKLASLSDTEPYFAEVVISEGKFHQVKRMFEAAGNKVLYLKRTKMNYLALDEKLELGHIRELTDAELELLQKTN